MLQINSGKLFQLSTQRENLLRGVLYSNLILASHDQEVRTAAGTLLSTGSIDNPSTIVYEVTERIEGDEIAAGVLISHTVKPYLQDFATVVSFCLGVICTPNEELATRLLTRTSRVLYTPPSKLIKRVFDAQVWCHDADADRLKVFVENLIGLKRKSFLATMKAMRTYVAALHRVADDAELAYTLMVAAIESLVQEFDAHKPKWSDLDESKRLPLDKALRDASREVSEAVRGVVIDAEHVALTRRFRDFAISHLPEAYFYGEGEGRVGPVGRMDAEDALKQAYKFRSSYVHTLIPAPFADDGHVVQRDTAYRSRDRLHAAGTFGAGQDSHQ